MAPSFDAVEDALNVLFADNKGEELKECVQQLLRRIEKLLDKPDKKVRKINSTKEAYQKIKNCPGGAEFIRALGFLPDGPEHLVLAEENENKLHLMKAKRTLRTRAVDDGGLTDADLDGEAAVPVVSKPIFGLDTDLASSLAPPPAFDAGFFDNALTSAMAPPPDFDLGSFDLGSPPELSKKDRLALIDGEFFKFSNVWLRPGGKCNKKEVGKSFRKTFNKTTKYMVTVTEGEEALFRWNAEYAKVGLDYQGNYVGFHTYDRDAPAPQPTAPVEPAAVEAEADEEDADEGTATKKKKPVKKRVAKKKGGDATADADDEDESYRTEIEKLLLDRMPDEIDNLDVMMDQFGGREDELIETLQNMPSVNKKPKVKKIAKKKSAIDDTADADEEKPKKKVLKKKKSFAESNGADPANGEVSPRSLRRKVVKKKGAPPAASDEEEKPSSPKRKVVKKKSDCESPGAAEDEVRPKSKRVVKKKGENTAIIANDEENTKKKIVKKKVSGGAVPGDDGVGEGQPKRKVVKKKADPPTAETDSPKKRVLKKKVQRPSVAGQ